MNHSFLSWIFALLLLAGSPAMAQPEPTMNDIYATAQAGRLAQAQVMLQQVLVAHPNSAKAHFVESELFARQGNLPRAREALSQAEKLAPGLPFAKPEAVQLLRGQLYSATAPTRQVSAAPQAPAASAGNWLLPMLLAVGVIGIAYLVFRPRRPQVYVTENNGLSGPQNFGGNGGAVMQPSYGGGPYGGAPYGQPMYGQAPGSGLGGRIMGGVATGLAVGAGVVAAEAIGRNLMGGHDQGSSHIDNNSYEPYNGNADMGGQNFGINDSSSWDDGGGGGGGGDWDN